MSRATKVSVRLLFVLSVLLTFAVNAWAAADTSSTAVTAPTNNTHVAFGAGFTFVASVHDTQGGTTNADPGGTVSFFADATAITLTTCTPTGGTTLGSVATVNVDATHDSATLNVVNVSALISAGTHTITACFLSNDTTNSGWKSSDSFATTVNLIVDPAPTTTTTISVSGANSVIGQPVTFTATVTPANGSSGMTLDGMVMFIANGSTCASPTFLGVASLTPANNTATTAAFETPSLSFGAHTVDACYLGNANFPASNSTGGTHASVTVGSRSTSATISSLQPSAVGLTVTSTVNAQVADTAGFPAGTAGGFTVTGSLVTARSQHASALLPNGNLLVVGGTDTSGAVISNTGCGTAGACVAEIFASSAFSDHAPSTGSFLGRTGGTATLLQNGTILLLGGSANGSAASIADPQIYDPVADKVYTLSADANNNRMNHTATLMSDGRVLILGGQFDSGGGAAAINTAAVFVPGSTGTGTFSAVTGNLGTARFGHTATLLTAGANAGKVLVTGGDSGTSEFFAISGTTGTSTPAPNLAAARSFHSATNLPSGLVVLAGGIVSFAAVNSIEFYDPVANSFTLVSAALDTARQAHTTSLQADGTILFVGGSGGATSSGGLASAAVYATPYDPQGAATLASSDVNDTVSQGSAPPCAALVVTGTGTTVCIGSVTPTATSTPGSHTVSVTYTDNHTSGPVHANNSNLNNTATLTVSQLTVTAVQDSKTYDGTTSPSSGSVVPTLTGTLTAGDVFCGTQTFQTKDVAAGTAVTVPVTTNVIRATNCSGTDHTGNYTISYVNNTTSTITPKALTMSGLSVPASKVYDGTTTAVVSGSPGSLQATEAAGAGTTSDGKPYSVDSVSLTGTATGTYDSKDVLTASTVTFGGVSLTGTGSGNYTLTIQGTAAATITPKTLTVSGITASNKVYDRTTTATLNTGSAALVGVIGLDAVTLNTGASTGTFSDKNVGTGKTVTVGGLTISGADAGNYTLTQPTTTADITPATLTVSGITASNKVYDATKTATLSTGSAALVGVIGLDAVTLNTGASTGTFSDKNVGTGKTVTVAGLTISGADAGNYTLTQPTTTADITALAITGSITVSNKVYDATTAATIATRSLTGVLLTDVVSYNCPSATFSDKNVGIGKLVTANGCSLTGTDAANYTVNSTATTTANITALAITGSITANNKPYDGTVAATIATRSLTGVLTGDVVSYVGGTATFSDKAVANGKTVTATGLSLTGADAGNYTVNTTAITTANITPIGLTIIGAVGVSRTYDGTNIAQVNFSGASLVGVLSGDTVTINSTGYSATFADKLIGTAKPITVIGVLLAGTDAGNYTLSQPAGLTANITGLLITGSITASNKVYDGTTAATIATRTLTGVATGDVVTYVGGTATFSDKNVGVGKTVTATGLSLSGPDAGNYVVNTTATTTANITQKALTVSATGVNKVYDGTTTTTVTLSDNRIAGDVLTTAYTTATFADKNVGTGKVVSVSGISISGTDAANYSFNTTTATTANITARPITLTANNINKVLGTVFTFTGTEFTQTGLASGDTLTSVTITSPLGSPIAATFGTYPIIITPLATGNYTGTLLTSNYAITLVNGVMSVGQADTFVELGSALTVANNAAGGTFTLTVSVGSKTTGTPTGTVAFTDNGTAIAGSPVTLAAGAASLASITLSPSSTPHVIIATYSGDTNYKGSTITVDISVAPAPAVIVAGTAAAPTAAVTYSGSLTTSGTLSSADLTCTISSAVVAVVPALTNCTATLNATLTAGGSGTVTINIHTTAGTIGSLRPLDIPAGSSFRSLYALSLAMPAIAFIGLAAPFGSLRNKSLRRKLLCWLGLVLVVSLLVVSVGCGGGGFVNPSNLGATGTVNKTQAGSYTAVVTYTDANNKSQVLVSMPFTVN